MNTKPFRHWPIALIATISIIMLLLTFRFRVIYWQDQGFNPYGARFDFLSQFYEWNTHYGMGTLSLIGPVNILVDVQYALSLLAPPWLAEMLTIWVFMFLGSVGTYIYLSRRLRGHGVASTVAPILASLVYLSNPYWVDTGLWNPFQVVIVSAGLLPYLFILVDLVAEALRSRGTIPVRYLALTYVVGLLVFYNSNVFFSLVLLVLLPYIVAIIVSELRNLRLFAKFLSFLAVISLSLGVSALPLIRGIQIAAGSSGITSSSAVRSSWSDYVGSSFPLYKILLGRPWGAGASQFFSEFYSSPAFLVVAAAVIALALLPLMVRPARRASAAYFGLLIAFLAVVTLWNGVRSPFAALLRALFFEFPYLQIIRSTTTVLTFLAPFLISSLTGFGIFCALVSVKKRGWRIFAAILIAVIVAAYGYPMLSGNGLISSGVPAPQPRMGTAAPYLGVASTINSDGNLSTVVVVPPAAPEVSTESYYSLDIYYHLLNDKNIIDGGYISSTGAHDLYFDFFNWLTAVHLPVANYQQEVNISSSNPIWKYINFTPGYVASNLVFFYRNGTVIPSWLETYAPSHSPPYMLFWVKLPNLPAGSSMDVYVGIAGEGTNYYREYDGSVGEAPQLSPTYGEYDSGANVFNFYDDFAGTSLNAKLWNVSSATGYTVNNGLTVNPSGSVTSYASFSQGVIETYGNITPGGRNACCGGAWFGLAGDGYGIGVSLDSFNTSIINLIAPLPGNGAGTFWTYKGGMGVWSLIVPSPTSELLYGQFNYSNTVSVLINPGGEHLFGNHPLPIKFGVGINLGRSVGPFYWVRVRSLPTAGSMPVTLFGSLNNASRVQNLTMPQGVSRIERITILNEPYALKLLQILNAKYLVVEGDAVPYLYGTPNYNLSEILAGVSDLNLKIIYRYGNVSLYEVSGSPGLFYSPSRVYLANSSQIPDVLEQSWYNASDDAVLTPVSAFGNSAPQQLGAMEWAESNAARADILTLNGNPEAGFHLLVNASHPFVLVFSQEYDPRWVAEVNGAPVPRQDHFVVYGYANGWLVNSTGILRIYIYYAPQLALERLYAISFAISIIILGASALFLKKRLFT